MKSAENEYKTQSHVEAYLAGVDSFPHLSEGQAVLFELLPQNLTHVLDLGANIDTTTPSGKLVFGIFAALAEFERDLIRERTIAGLAAARARGRVGGRKPKMNKHKPK